MQNRKICSLCSVCEKVYNKLIAFPESISRASAPHLAHNKPLMNKPRVTTSSPSPAPGVHLDGLVRDEKLRPHIPVQKMRQISNDNDSFPFINHSIVDLEMRNELWKAFPKTSKWETFSGENP